MFAANQAAAQTVTNASDNAGNYGGGWTNGANGGTGFGAWTVTSSTNTNGSAGAFIGNPTNAGITTNAVFGAQAFGLYANPEATGVFVNTDRTFPLLQVGQTFSFQWAVNYESGGGNKGFNVYSGGTGGAQIANVNQGGPPGDITLNGSNAITNYGTAPMTWSFTRTAPNNLLVTSTPRDGSTNIAYSTNITISAAPDAIQWYAANLSASFKDERQPYFNNLLIAGPAPVTNQVTFTVNMAYQASQGLFSTNNSDTVQVVGDFNNWNTSSNSIYALTNQGNNIFGGTFPISATEGTPLNYKFWNSATNAPNSGFESGANRVFTMGANGTTNTLPVVYFSNLAGERFVTFSVNMAIQQAKGAFNPASNNVLVRGNFGGGWDILTNQLTSQGGNVYSGSFLLSSSNTNTSVAYKFFTTGTTPGWEAGDDRTFNLVFNTDGSNSPALVLATNYFGNELFYVTGTPLNAFSTTQGTASAAQSVTVSGQGLTTDVSVLAPTGFEVSTNGASYVGSLSIAPISNTISAATLYTRIAASAAVGSPAGNVDLTSTGSRSVNIAVSGTVNASGQTFSKWAQGAPLNSTNLLKYAIGGATNATATNGIAISNAVTSSNLSITAIVRTNDPNLSVLGQSIVNLGAGTWTNSDVSRITDGVNQTGVPSGNQRQIFSTPLGTDGKKFLRLQTTLSNQ
jgi:hypothetical protein